jgi:hypothetical protein
MTRHKAGDGIADEIHLERVSRNCSGFFVV